MKKSIVAAISVVLLVACGSSASGQSSPSFPPGVEYHDMPNGFPGQMTWCSHGFRLWLSYHNGPDAYGSNSSIGMTSQPDPGCAK